jgi:hypothetical protein
MFLKKALSVGFLLLVSATPVLASKLCIMHERSSPATGTLREGPACSQDGHESFALNIGDDTGWRNQQLAFWYHARGSSGWVETPWQCSVDGHLSPWIQLGDDTGWRDQALQIVSSSNEPACFRHTRAGSNGISSTGLVCSSNNQPSGWAWIGDDTGYRGQRISVVADTLRP